MMTLTFALYLTSFILRETGAEARGGCAALSPGSRLRDPRSSLSALLRWGSCKSSAGRNEEEPVQPPWNTCSVPKLHTETRTLYLLPLSWVCFVLLWDRVSLSTRNSLCTPGWPLTQQIHLPLFPAFLEYRPTCSATQAFYQGIGLQSCHKVQSCPLL